ncbi:MAG: hypothetical protein FJ319_05005 [SAR202 cluster bacterium]|nr:hypothetical protein [SAR202 cluster bacterium]
MDKLIWKVGHILCRRGLVAEACELRFVSLDDAAGREAQRASAALVVDRLRRERSIDDAVCAELMATLASGRDDVAV